ncbi:TPA: hydroxymethylglutaryl-CoA synthase [archaeon]|uniref:Hydroxymethylglutaryl-CoA synthase n=1 Tax=Candidatus Naiadarchaeum limnaeum TaxID=2756139 RepID=A0A832V1H7_9ARCH|nr:hydroxymethylglutaryl-CoA synthase [Candidatus Naiadarchaeales archaeon SRR2090153.bin1042]HIK00348.1 hydroxymethylglutaryl-CoA synthase [Candidatus Naiadarchaeum limnaeum]
MDVGIVGYGAYVPMYRIKAEEIAKVWGADANSIKRGLAIEEKSVPGPDEDTATITVEAARHALKMAQIDPQEIGAIYIGSESHPYAVKPTATIVAEAIGATPNLTAADLEFACKAGTAGIQICMGLVQSGMIKYGLAGGADTSQGAPGDPLEYTASAGGAVFIIGKNSGKVVAEIESTLSFTTDTPDFWRREGADYPRHGGRFTGEPAYFKHIIACTEKMMETVKAKPSDFDYVVFHQPNGKFPMEAGKQLGFKPEQILPGLLVPKIGNTYSGASLLGLAAVLDIAKADQRILVTSYGSGAGSDSFVLRTTKELPRAREKGYPVQKYIDNKKYLDYGTYAKYRGKITMAVG